MKRVTFLVDDILYKKAKIKSVLADQNMTEYLISLIKKDLSENETKKRTNTVTLASACVCSELETR